MRAGWRRVGRLISAAGAIVVSAALLGVMGFGYGTIPALGPAIDPGRGAWTSAADGAPAPDGAPAVTVALGMGIPPLPAAPTGWYRCPSPAGYFPYIGVCSGPWELTQVAPPP